MATKAEKRALRLKQRTQDVKKQRAAATRRRRNKKIINATVIALVALIVAFFAYKYIMQQNAPGKYDALAQCLTREGAGMYGTDWCPNCQNQKQMFGNSFKYVTYINCDANPTACDSQGVTGYPTWIFNDGSRLIGTQSLDALAEQTGCALE